ncbi:Transposase DDE domain-containing protein [Halarsenatibacter silvermanii]|uniref:Transposase DDE domain-containing protein n=2 Tax=Halarsenatibacter silvermanii TaxID=321763 RepID=A0A1G9SB25_9FIRM|nr:Transposase DDE domain-containing protein [Halarsenatibacter silvermanii]
MSQEDENHTKKMCDLSSYSVYCRYLRQLKDGTLTLDKGQTREYARYDGKYLIETSDDKLSAEYVALRYKQLVDIEDVFLGIKSNLEIKPMYYRTEDRICSHVKLCWLGMLLVRVIENETAKTC